MSARPSLPEVDRVEILTLLRSIIATRGAGAGRWSTAIIEPILTILGAQPTVYDQLGIVPGRTGNRTPNTAPRNTYRTRDGKWVAISASAQSVAERVVRLVGRPDYLG